MSYLALARKWRPRVFADAMGQGHVVKALSHALDGDKLQRASYRVLDRAQDSEPVRTVLLDKVKELRLRYMDKEREWVDQWPQQDLQQQSQPAADGSQTQRDTPPPLAIEVSSSIVGFSRSESTR